ncbi:hypothetical protein JMUB7552_27190 [Staphylococcus aureus]
MSRGLGDVYKRQSFFFKQKTAYEIAQCLVGSEMCIRDRFDWGGRLLKGNGGAQRFPQNGWKSFIECKGIRELYCETYKSSRVERRT